MSASITASVKVAAGCDWCGFGGLLGEEAFEIVTLALERLGDARLGGRRHRRHFLGLDPALLVHPENPRYPLDAADQRRHVVPAVIDSKARPRCRIDAERRHQRLGAMMAGPNRDPALVQYGADVVGMHPLDREGDDAGAVVGPNRRTEFKEASAPLVSRTSAASCAAIASRADPRHIVDRGMKPDHADHVRRPPGSNRAGGGA